MRLRGLPAIFIMLGLCLMTGQALGQGIDSTHKYAWSENTGWLNFNPAQGDVAVYATHLEGYVWGENVGWIRLGTHTGGGTHTYANTDETNYGVNRTGNQLSGFAWSENTGWINFNPTHGGVSINPATGDFSGYAWGENIGWIKFAGTALDDTVYKVKMADTAPTVTTQAVTGIGTTTATGHGNITDLGTPNPTAYGACWSTTADPTTADSCTDKGGAASTGAFTANITGLSAGTTYYVRAFAANTAGTSYGDNRQFTTTLATYTVTPTAGTGGTVSDAGTYAHGTQVTVQAFAASGYVFVNWTEGSTVVSCDAQYSFRVTGNRTLRANFSPVRSQYTIAGAAKPASYGTVNGSGPYNHGANVTMTVLLSHQGVFLTNWIETWPGLAGYCVVSEDEQYTFPATRNRNLTANVRPKTLPGVLMLLLDE
ncbi:hypothetical protein C6366_16775 [Desulfonatronum sp. SC1]|nr:hypothetical protein C6366_16775 [Desulfonatronum sp. SC1]